MLSRRSQLTLPSGTSRDLPLLIPSFSSKGFGFTRSTAKGQPPLRSHASSDLVDFARSPGSSVLLSGYDLHFAHFQDPQHPRRHTLDIIDTACLIFIDSGGYELSPEFDTCEPKSHPYQPLLGYSRPEFAAVLADVRHRSGKQDFAISNFDWGTKGQALAVQIKDARSLARLVPNALHGFIIKPWTPKMTYVDPRKMSEDDFADMAGFFSIGVTEKELGPTLFDRLRRVAELRVRLDRNGITAPIHVWGGLDPILTALYFFAGAQLFDGISWLRYAFVDGLAVNRESAIVLDQHLDVTSPRRISHPMLSLTNRTTLDRLTGHLQQWVDYDGARFDMFAVGVRDRLANAYAIMRSRIPELRGSH